MTKLAKIVATLWAAASVATLPGPTFAQLPFGEQSYEYELSDVLPEATDFERRDSYWVGTTRGDDGQPELVGYVLLTDDLVRLARERIVTPEEVYSKAVDKQEVLSKLKVAGFRLG